jgi:hypothetical protein
MQVDISPDKGTKNPRNSSSDTELKPLKKIHLNPITDSERIAGIKILRWYTNCRDVRSIENKLRSYVLKKNSKNRQPVFSVHRVVTANERKKLEQEVGTILAYYNSPDGRELLDVNQLAEANKSIWMSISLNLSEKNCFLPIVVRDRNGELQSVALVLPDKIASTLHLEDLATLPLNLGRGGKYRGAGTAAFEDAVFLCARRGFSKISFTTAPSSRPFYGKLGVHLVDNLGSLSFDKFRSFFLKHGGKAHPLKT